MKNLTDHSIRTRLKRVVRLIRSIAFDEGMHAKRIHSLRVETRRTNVALQIFADWLPGQHAAWIGQHVKRIRRKAGSIRDLDILVPIVSKHRDQLAIRAFHRLTKRIARLRSKQMRSLKRSCRDLLDRGFEKRIRTIIRRIGWRHSWAAPNPDEFCADTISALATKFLDAVDRLKTDCDHLHRARILGRRLRDTLAFLNDFVSATPSAVVVRCLGEIQELLGSAHDRIWAREFLQTSPFLGNATKDSYERLIHLLDTTMSEAVRLNVRDAIDRAETIRSFLAAIIPAPFPQDHIEG